MSRIKFKSQQYLTSSGKTKLTSRGLSISLAVTFRPVTGNPQYLVQWGNNPDNNEYWGFGLDLTETYDSGRVVNMNDYE
jgi:hypothetical protein